MPDLDLQPEIVGRDGELEDLQRYLDQAEKGQGHTVLVAGEAGIGKTRLADELKKIAEKRGFRTLSGNSLHESLTPFTPFIDALRSGGLEHLFAEEAPRVLAVYLVTDTGLLVKAALRDDTDLDPDLFASMLSTVGNFVKDSLSMLEGEETQDSLNRLGYGGYTILVECHQAIHLAVILTGRENEFLVNDMRDVLYEIGRFYGSVLKEWDGDDEGLAGVEEILQPLITSGKYDGIYYGKGDPMVRRNLLFENVALGLERTSRAVPTFLCLEDLHWADPSSLALMHYVARNAKKCNLLIMGTYRPEDIVYFDGRTHPLVETMQLMSREDLYRRMELQRLPEDRIPEFISSLLGETDFDERFMKRVFEETEGNPLFIIELTKLLINEGAISKDKDVWRLLKGQEDVDVPTKIQDLVLRRLNRLKDEERTTLDFAAVIGERFSTAILSSVTGLERVLLLRQLRRLEQIHRLVHPRNGWYRFDHSKIKEVLYDDIPRELRMEYHSIVAESIEALNKDDIEGVIGDLAFHYYRCRNREKASRYLLEAAEKARKEYSNVEAARLYSNALEFEEDRKKRMEILLALGLVYDLGGEYDRSIEAYRSALELTDSVEKSAEIQTLVAMIHTRKEEFDEARRISSEALGLVEGKSCKANADALDILGLCCENSGAFNEAIEYAQRSLDIRNEIGDRKGMARSLNNIGNSCFHQGKVGESLGCLLRSLEIREKLDDMRDIASSFNNIGMYYGRKGELDEALKYFEKSFRTFEKVGVQRGMVTSLGNIANVHAVKGKHQQAEEVIQRSLKVWEKIGRQSGYAVTLINLANIRIARRDFEGALTLCNEALEVLEAVGRKPKIGHVKQVLGAIYTGMHKWEDSIRNFEESIQIYEETGQRIDLACTHYHYGLMWKAKGNADEAREHLGKALDVFEELGSPESIEDVKGVLASLEGTQQDGEKST